MVAAGEALGVGGKRRRVTVTLARPSRSSAFLKRSESRRAGKGRETTTTTTTLLGHDNIPMATDGDGTCAEYKAIDSRCRRQPRLVVPPPPLTLQPLQPSGSFVRFSRPHLLTLHPKHRTRLRLPA